MTIIVAALLVTAGVVLAGAAIAAAIQRHTDALEARTTSAPNYPRERKH